MRRYLLVAFLLFTCLTYAIAQKRIADNRLLHDGDLLFVVPEHENSITEVTRGVKACSIDHVGIFHRHDGRAMVIEAVYEGVRETTWEDFIAHSPTILVGRVKGKLDTVRSLANAHEMLGRHYDFVFLPDNADIYCSELVQISFYDIQGRQVFQPIPMSFHDKNGIISPYWKDFYSRRGLEVPEGEPGSNPGELSRRKCVRIKYLLTCFDK